MCDVQSSCAFSLSFWPPCIPSSPQIDTSTAVCIYLDVPAGRWEARYFKI